MSKRTINKPLKKTRGNDKLSNGLEDSRPSQTGNMEITVTLTKQPSQNSGDKSLIPDLLLTIV